MPNKVKTRHNQRKFILLMIGFGVLIIVLLLELTNTTHLFHKTSTSSTASAPVGSSSKEETLSGGTAQTSTSGSNPSTNNDDSKSFSNANVTAMLLTPSGDFVSDHHPNLSGLPNPNTINSVCTTTPEATCVITFTKNGVVKSLDSETTDSNGSVFWSWNLNSIGLTAGSWQIQAVASLNGQTKTASDSLNLEVSP